MTINEINKRLLRNFLISISLFKTFFVWRDHAVLRALKTVRKHSSL